MTSGAKRPSASKEGVSGSSPEEGFGNTLQTEKFGNFCCLVRHARGRQGNIREHFDPLLNNGQIS